MKLKKILFYSHDTFGLGHISRILAIGQYLAKHREDVRILLVSGSGIIHRIKIPAGIDYVKLPSVVKIGDDRYKSKHLPLSLNKIIKLRETILLDTALSFEPDIFVIDNVPLGLKKEAQKTIETLKKSRPGCKIVLTMRDILDDPEKIKRLWKQDSVYEAIDKYFDSVLVFGLKNIFDTITEYNIPESIGSKLQFCGYIRRAQAVSAPEKVRVKLSVNGHRLILVTVGGGGDGDKIVETTLEGLAHYGGETLKSFVVLGPDFPEKKGKELKSRYGFYKNINIVDFVSNLGDFMNAADLVISMGGYNTICEILSLNKRAIVVPRVKPRVEQLIRAQRFSELDLLEYLHPEDLSPELVQEKIEANLLDTKSSAHAINLNGLENSAAVFERFLQL